MRLLVDIERQIVLGQLAAQLDRAGLQTRQRQARLIVVLQDQHDLEQPRMVKAARHLQTLADVFNRNLLMRIGVQQHRPASLQQRAKTRGAR